MIRLLCCFLVAVQGALLFALPTLASSSVEGLRIRAEPVLCGSVITLLKKNEEVLVLERSTKQETIDGRTGYWFRVIGISGEAGWVFGGYLDITAGMTDELAVQTEEELQITTTDYSERFGHGRLVLITVTAESFIKEHSLPELSVMFVRPRPRKETAAAQRPTKQLDRPPYWLCNALIRKEAL